MMDEKELFFRIFLVLLCLMLSGLSLVNVAAAQSKEATVGVNVGDWAKYGDILITWDSTDPHAKPDRELSELNNTSWFSNNVTNTEYSVISFQQTTQFKNDTQRTSTASVDIDAGIGLGLLMFISAGLEFGDVIYPSAAEDASVMINETIFRSYAGVTREVNHLNLTQSQQISDPPQTVYVSVNHYWDKETGILTERFGTFRNQTESYITTWTRSEKIVETNLWGVEDQPEASDFQFWPLGVVTAIAIIIATWMLWTRKKRRLKTKKSRRRH